MNAYPIAPPFFGNWKVLQHLVLELIEACRLPWFYWYEIMLTFMQHSCSLNVIWQQFCDLNCLFAYLSHLPVLHLSGRPCQDSRRCGPPKGEIQGLSRVIWHCSWRLLEIPGQYLVNSLFWLLSVWFHCWAWQMLNGTPDQSHLAWWSSHRIHPDHDHPILELDRHDVIVFLQQDSTSWSKSPWFHVWAMTNQFDVWNCHFGLFLWSTCLIIQMKCSKNFQIHFQ